MSHGGKGDTPRPYSVSPEEFSARHEIIFGKKEPRKPWVYVPPEKENPEKQENTENSTNQDDK
ncbi:hypothetical protein UFOVP71_117 [uncultured Caudovirales phage]|uniref:Uncharacterized protein n=1 Tax=uncultured Caudovirales phage TaxID=2100421 RepID=A0A6J5TBD6_9CAUD|nr:hypothetical protein UFOVP71_117 [uncultured Caudovirales phage]